MASKAVPFDVAGGSTPGQVTLAFIHTELDWRERRTRVHPWCVGELDRQATGELVTCEVCHKDFNPAEMEELRDRYQDEIYRPGEDVAKLELLSDDEKSERRTEIEAIFADPEKYRAEQEARMETEDGPEPVTIKVENE